MAIVIHSVLLKFSYLYFATVPPLQLSLLPLPFHIQIQLFTLRESPPAHSEALPMRADGQWKEETHIVKQSGQGEEGEEGVEQSWRLSWSIGGLLGAMGLF